ETPKYYRLAGKEEANVCGFGSAICRQEITQCAQRLGVVGASVAEHQPQGLAPFVEAIKGVLGWLGRRGRGHQLAASTSMTGNQLIDTLIEIA
ncbi:hypothetical protein BN1708_017216, partial [Verticillium longisporum]